MLHLITLSDTVSHVHVTYVNNQIYCLANNFEHSYDSFLSNKDATWNWEVPSTTNDHDFVVNLHVAIGHFFDHVLRVMVIDTHTEV